MGNLGKKFKKVGSVNQFGHVGSVTQFWKEERKNMLVKNLENWKLQGQGREEDKE